jgi:putative FmdB family regulatory protein
MIAAQDAPRSANRPPARTNKSRRCPGWSGFVPEINHQIDAARLPPLESIDAFFSRNRLTLMPLYEYECKKCGHRFEKIQKFSDKMVKKCPDCGGVVEQMISAPAVQFKGSGWYVTDYAKKSSAGSSSSSSDSPSSNKDESSASLKDSSKDSKKDDKSKSDGAKDSSSKDSSAKESSSKKDSKAK